MLGHIGVVSANIFFARVERIDVTVQLFELIQRDVLMVLASSIAISSATHATVWMIWSIFLL